MAAQRLEELPVRRGPEADFAVLARGHDAFAVARKSDAEDRALVPGERLHQLVLAEPDDDGVRGAARLDLGDDQPVAVG